MKLYQTAFERVVGMYQASKQRFSISTRPYFSTGGFQFDVTQSFPDQPIGSGLTRLVLLASPGQQIRFFSYGLEDTVAGVGLADRTATDADTNQVERTNTNNEDFVIEGISATARGYRIRYPDGGGIFNNPIVDLAVTGSPGEGGGETIADPGANVLPPEVSSPVTLQDVLFQALRTKVSLRTEWNRKAGDYIGTLDEMPEGGGNSYLLSNGEPSAMNYWRVPEGYIWRREGAPEDTIFTVTARLELPVICIATLPLTFQDQQATLGLPSRVDLDWKMRMHGKALYLPSQNV